MTRHLDDWDAPILVRSLRWMREEVAYLERIIIERERDVHEMKLRRQALLDAIADAEREIEKRGD